MVEATAVGRTIEGRVRPLRRPADSPPQSAPQPWMIEGAVRPLRRPAGGVRLAGGGWRRPLGAGRRLLAAFLHVGIDELLGIGLQYLVDLF